MKTNAIASTLLSLALAGTAASAGAAVPTAATFEGVLTSAGGGPAADGTYQITFAVYAAASGGTALWSEGPVAVTAKGGQISYQMGSKSPLSAAGLNTATAFLGIQIGSDPELPRQPLGASLFALRAAVAEGLDCSGCLKGAMLDSAVLQPYAKTTDLGAYAKATDLSGYAKTADLGVYAKSSDLGAYAQTATLAKVAQSGLYADLKSPPVLADVAKTGSYGDLLNLPVLAKVGTACGTGLVLNGFKADGSADCGALKVAADYIDEISNGLIWNQFVDGTSGTADVGIPDGKGAGVSDSLLFPDIGSAQALWVDVALSNSDVSKITIELYAPNSATPYILYSGGKAGTGFKVSFNKDTALVSGDMNKDWIGKNIAGTWSITVKDPNDNVSTTNDGKFNWAVNIQTLSTKKIQIKGNLIVDGTLQIGGTTGGISGAITYKDFVNYENSWCPAQPNGDRSMVLGGICTPGVGRNNDWPTAVAYCNGKKADVCSGAQSLVLRRLGALGNYTSWANWTNSYADNDGGLWYEAVGPIADDHGTGTGAMAPCCYNVTPKRSTDQIVKINPTDVGIRVLHIHNVADVTFGYAATFCTQLNADLCNRSEMVTLRTAGKISANFFWANSADDTDSQVDYGAAGNGAHTPDNVNFDDHQGAFACCAQGGDRTGLACPAGSTEQSGICVTKVNNTGATFVNAAKDCATTGGHLCTVSQNYKLRSVGYITGGGTWSSNMEDCDGASSSCGNGSVGDNINPAANFTYACCL